MFTQQPTASERKTTIAAAENAGTEYVPEFHSAIERGQHAKVEGHAKNPLIGNRCRLPAPNSPLATTTAPCVALSNLANRKVKRNVLKEEDSR